MEAASNLKKHSNVKVYSKFIPLKKTAPNGHIQVNNYDLNTYVFILIIIANGGLHGHTQRQEGEETTKTYQTHRVIQT